MHDFLLSIENHARVTSLTINEDCVGNVAHCDVDVEHDKKAGTRELYRKALNEEFYFTDVPGSDGNSLIVLVKNTEILTSVMI